MRNEPTDKRHIGGPDDAAARMPTAAELLAATGGGRAAAGAADLAGHERPNAEEPAERMTLAGLEAALGLSEASDAKALRAAADAEPGVRSRSCLIRTDAQSGGTTVIISIAVAYGVALHRAADGVRGRIAAAAPGVLGVPAGSVRVDVNVVWLDEPVRA